MIIKDKSEIKNVTRGYNCLARTVVLLAENKNLTLREFGFYLLLGLLMDWEPKHINTFGIVKLTLSELSEFLNLSESTVYRYIENLTARRLVELRSGVVYIYHPERFLKPYADEIKKYKIANLEELLAKEKEIFADVQEKLAKLRLAKGDRIETNHTKTTAKPTLGGNHRNATGDSKDFRGSFKGYYKSSEEDLTDDEIRDIAKQIGRSERESSI